MGANFRDAAEKIRSRADTAAKTLGGLGTTVLTAIGIVKFGDIFPLPPLDKQVWAAIVVVITSFLTLAGVVAFFTRRLWKLNEPLVQRTDPELMELNDEELELVRGIYKIETDLNGVESLGALEARALRLLRIAERLPTPAPAADGKPAMPDEPKRVRDEAADTIVVVRAT